MKRSQTIYTIKLSNKNKDMINSQYEIYNEEFLAQNECFKFENCPHRCYSILLRYSLYCDNNCLFLAYNY